MTTRTARIDYLFWIAAIALLFFRLGDTAMWQSEDRWLEVAREMLLSGKYFHPTVNDTLYFDKPLFSYWLVVASSFITGLNEWALRLPSALAALAALWATADLAKQLWNAKTARYAGWILLTSLGFLQWARLGEADMENLAATIVAVNWYWRQRDRSTFFGYVIFYLILSIGAQCKGLTAMIVPGLAVLAEIVIAKRWRIHFNIRHLLAAAVGAFVYLLPFLLAPAEAHANTHSGLWQVLHENIVRYVAPFDHTGPIHTYLIAIPRMLFPWSVLFVFALIAGLRNRWQHATHALWLLITFLAIFVFFTLSGSRRYYYILPILPYCALMMAAYLQTARAQVALWITAGLLALTGILQLSLLILFARLNQRVGGDLPATIQTASMVIGLLTLTAMTAVYFAQRNSNNKLIASCIAGALILLGGFFFLHQLTINSVRTEAAFARQLAPIVREHPDLQIATFQDRPPAKLLFYADMPPTVKILRSADELQQFIASTQGPKLILAYRERDAALPATLTGQMPVVAEQQFSWEKNNDEKMRAWLLH